MADALALQGEYDSLISPLDASEPYPLFQNWFAAAARFEKSYPDAAVLATIDEDDWPSARTVLVKAHDAESMRFFTNLDSDKARALRWMPRAALCFHWKSLGLQVRVQGAALPVSGADADAYFSTRERGSQIGAWISTQSRPLIDYPRLLADFEAQVALRDGTVIERPSNWGGFDIRIRCWEFWSEGKHRLHQRKLFEKASSGWRSSLLYP